MTQISSYIHFFLIRNIEDKVSGGKNTNISFKDKFNIPSESDIFIRRLTKFEREATLIREYSITLLIAVVFFTDIAIYRLILLPPWDENCKLVHRAVITVKRFIYLCRRCYKKKSEGKYKD